jgi:hypothetical protein
MKEKELNELAADFFATMFSKPKKKILRPLVKQLTYKGVTKKWTYDGIFINFVGGRSIDFELAKQDGETIRDFVKRKIDEELRKED